MYNFCWVRMVGAFIIHLVPNLRSSKLLRQVFEIINNIPETVKNSLFFVTYFISYLLFRVISTKQLMINAASFSRVCSVERSVTEQQFLNSRPAVIVIGVQDPGLTPLGEFVPRSAPQIGSSIILHAEVEVCQFPDRTR